MARKERPIEVLRSRLEFKSKRSIDGPELNGVRCLEWIGATNGGYGRIWDGFRLQYTHRVAWKAKHGPVPGGKDVLHACDNPRCIEWRHLWCGTHRENMDDMLAKGRGRNGADKRRGRPSPMRGRKHPKAIIRSREQACSIFLDQRQGTVIAEENGVAPSTVYAIKKGRLWAWATRDLRLP